MTRTTPVAPPPVSRSIHGNLYIYSAALTGFLLHYGERLYKRDEAGRAAFEARVMELTAIVDIQERATALEHFAASVR